MEKIPEGVNPIIQLCAFFILTILKIQFDAYIINQINKNNPSVRPYNHIKLLVQFSTIQEILDEIEEDYME